MIEYFFQTFTNISELINLLGYISTRTLMAGISALLLTLFLGKKTINWLISVQAAQVIRKDGPQSHLSKQGTPTMGGVLIIFCTTLSTLLWMRIDSIYVWVSLFAFLLFSVIGFIDDWFKIKQQNSKGLSAKIKFSLQSVLAIIITLWIYFLFPEQSGNYVIPFFKNVSLNLGIFSIVISYFMITGFSNAVNLTDGLDGLVIMPVILIATALGIFAYLAGNVNLANYLYIPYLSGAGEISIISAAVIGASLGFLWFNSYPAEIFMGDVGSLSIGALLATLAILIRQEIIFLLMGAVFVAEALSVIIQVLYYKKTRKRFFLMAPIHHHFELKGMSEPKIIVRFWIITAILVMIGLASLKIR